MKKKWLDICIDLYVHTVVHDFNFPKRAKNLNEIITIQTKLKSIPQSQTLKVKEKKTVFSKQI